jgi:hypothetical protein
MLFRFFWLVCALTFPIAGKPLAQFPLPLDQLPEQNEDYSDSFGRYVTSSPEQIETSEIEDFFDKNENQEEAASEVPGVQTLIGAGDAEESLKSLEVLLENVQASRVSEDPTLAPNSSVDFTGFNETGTMNQFECTNCSSDNTSPISDFASTIYDYEQTNQETYKIIATVIGLAIIIFTVLLVLTLVIKWIIRKCSKEPNHIYGTSGVYRNTNSSYLGN